MNLIELFHQTCRANGNEPALFTESSEYTYDMLHRKIHGIAEKLKDQGVREGDFIGLWMENGAEFIISYYAIHHLGGIVVPVDPLSVAREMEYIIKNAGIKLVITSPHYKGACEEIQKNLPDIKVMSLQGRIPDGKPEEPAEIHTTEETLAKIIYTSGTTGTPKGAMLTHGNLMSNIESVAIVLKIGRGSRLLCILPLFHSFAAMVNMLTVLSTGAAVILMRQFRPDAALRAVEQYKITTLCGVPSMFLVMAKLDPAEKFDLSSLKVQVSGGAGLPPKIGEAFKNRFGLEVHEGYGLSEASPVVAVNPLELPNVTGSIGKVIPNVEVKIVDENFQEMPVGEIGELAVRGGNVMKGYLNLPEETASVLKDGWLLTGDMAKVDENDYIFIVDRKKEMILVRGHNVYPREVEHILYHHPMVSEVAVVPAKDDRSGEVVRAVIVPKESGQLTSKEIKDFCRDKLAHYKIPKIVDIVEALPKTSTGKILKRALIK